MPPPSQSNLKLKLPTDSTTAELWKAAADIYIGKNDPEFRQRRTNDWNTMYEMIFEGYDPPTVVLDKRAAEKWAITLGTEENTKLRQTLAPAIIKALLKLPPKSIIHSFLRDELIIMYQQFAEEKANLYLKGQKNTLHRELYIDAAKNGVVQTVDAFIAGKGSLDKGTFEGLCTTNIFHSLVDQSRSLLGKTGYRIKFANPLSIDKSEGKGRARTLPDHRASSIQNCEMYDAKKYFKEQIRPFLKPQEYRVMCAVIDHYYNPETMDNIPATIGIGKNVFQSHLSKARNRLIETAPHLIAKMHDLFGLSMTNIGRKTIPATTGRS